MANERLAYIKESPTAGNGLFASGDIPPGQLVLSLARPLISVVDIKHLADTCSNCFATSASPIGRDEGEFEVRACTGCKVLRYCGKKCQSQSWKRHHKLECSIFRAVSTPQRQLPNVVRACMQITAMRNLTTMSEEDWSALMRLESHANDIRSRHTTAAGKERIQQLEALSMGAAALSGQQASDPQLMQQNIGRASLSSSTLLRCRLLNLPQIWTNSFTLVAPTFEPLGLTLDPFAALANHSCTPNAFVVMDGPVLSLRSLTPIAKDDELLIAYIDPTNPFARRQHELQDRWYFSCACPKCGNGPTGPEDAWLRGASALPTKWQRAADAMRRAEPDLAADAASHVGSDAASRRLATLQARAFRDLDEAQAAPDPGEACDKLETGIRLCYQSGMWPLTRQPYPALRQELFASMLAAGRHELAWAQGVKTHFLVDPVLYPAPHHPLRVVHCWALALLTLFLASEQDSWAVQQMQLVGLDFGIVVYGLLVEVQANVVGSHGAESAFARAVGRKVEEVTVDMTRADPEALRGIGKRVEKYWKVFRTAADWIQM